MKRLMSALGLVAAAIILVFLATRPKALSVDVLPAHSANSANGEHLFYAGGCASCHLSPGDRQALPALGGGLEMDTPFGTFYVPNISPHPASGIGTWTTLDFVNAMVRGVSPGGRHYYPAFPYPSYSRMSFEDLIDLKAFLDTLPPIETRNKDHALKFPWNIRAGIGIWKWNNLDPEFVISIPTENAELKRGRYLAEGPGHCGECHTPRNWAGGLNNKRWLGGAPQLEGDGNVPNITPARNALSDWSQSDIAYYLETGFTPDFDIAGGTMVEVQENMARLPKDDLAAIAAYLKAIPPQE